MDVHNEIRQAKIDNDKLEAEVPEPEETVETQVKKQVVFKKEKMKGYSRWYLKPEEFKRILKK